MTSAPGFACEQILSEIEREARELLGPRYLGQDSESTAGLIEDLAISHVRRSAGLGSISTPLSPLLLQELKRLSPKEALVRAMALLVLSTTRREIEAIEAARIEHQEQPDYVAGFEGLAMWSCYGEDYVIAESAEAAVSITSRGNPGLEPGEGGAPDDWTRLPPEQSFKFETDFGPTARPVGFWVKSFGRGYFASPNC